MAFTRFHIFDTLLSLRKINISLPCTDFRDLFLFFVTVHVSSIKLDSDKKKGCFEKGSHFSKALLRVKVLLKIECVFQSFVYMSFSVMDAQIEVYLEETSTHTTNQRLIL